MKVIGDKATNLYWKQIEQDQKEAEYQGRDDMDIIEVSLSDRVNTMPVGSGTTVNAWVLTAEGYHRAHLSVKLESSEDPDIPLRDASLSHVTFFCALFRRYGFDFSWGTLSVTVTFWG